MNKSLRKIAKTILPKAVVDTLSSYRRSPQATAECVSGKEQEPDWYDQSFENADHWRVHYTRSRYYFLWSVIIDRMKTANCKSLLDVGCGPGQFACNARDQGIPAYLGLDFSPKRIEQARQICPEFDFRVEDVFETTLFQTHNYDSIIMTEFLEHIENDHQVVDQIRSGTHILATVPNFDYESHVRFFHNELEVEQRYRNQLRDLTITSLKGDEHSRVYFLIDGVKT